jgi:flagellar hook protein FlgE
MSIPSQLSAAHTLLACIGNFLANRNTTGYMFRHLLFATVGRYVQWYTL